MTHPQGVCDKVYSTINTSCDEQELAQFHAYRCQQSHSDQLPVCLRRHGQGRQDSKWNEHCYVGGGLNELVIKPFRDTLSVEVLENLANVPCIGLSTGVGQYATIAKPMT